MIRQKCLTNILAHTWESFSYYHHIIFRKRIRHSLQSFHIIQISGGNPNCVWFGIMEYYERIWVSFWSANDFHPLLAQIFSSTFLFVALFLFLLHFIFIFRLFDLFSSSGLLRLFSHLDLSSGGMLTLLRFVFPYIYISLSLCFRSKSIVHQSHF